MRTTSSASSRSGWGFAQGWRIAYLRQQHALEAVEKAADDLEPSLVVLSAVTATRVREAGDPVAEAERVSELVHAAG